jgi:osmoprotectant transport system substrate-binding protein
MSSVRRLLVATAALPLLLLGTSACSDEPAAADHDRSVTLVGQNFTEADILTELYRLLLDQQGFETTVQKLGARDSYLSALEKGEVQVAGDYLSTLTETLNRNANGNDATPVASADVRSTLAQLSSLGAKVGLTPLKPARAADSTAFAVTRAFAEKHDLSTLSDLGKLGTPVALAANSDCAERPDCGQGLRDVYGITLSKVEPLGFGSQDTKKALVDGEVQLGQVGTTDGSLDRSGLVVLRDDKSWQQAENLVPIVNSAWLKKNPKAAEALDRLSGVLTTEDLQGLNAEVDSHQLDARRAAEDYLKEKGLI